MVVGGRASHEIHRDAHLRCRGVVLFDLRHEHREVPRTVPKDPDDFPDYKDRLAKVGGTPKYFRPVCKGPIAVKDHASLRGEYEAIVAAGFMLQIDAPDLAMGRHIRFRDLDDAAFLRHAREQVDALNHALANVPADRARIHICWGNYDGPHHYSVNNFIEHPLLVAERICRYANIVGRDRVMAGSDCGDGTFAGFGAVHPRIAYAKLKSMREGADIASKRLWGRGLKA